MHSSLSAKHNPPYFVSFLFILSVPGQVMGGDQDPLTSPLTVRALLGPVSPVDAAKIQQEWKKSSAASKLLRLADPQKGLERQGR